jgi:hypothetical protein
MAVMQNNSLAYGLLAVTGRTFVARPVTLCIAYLWVVMSDIKCCLWPTSTNRNIEILVDKFNTHKILVPHSSCNYFTKLNKKILINS